MHLLARVLPAASLALAAATPARAQWMPQDSHTTVELRGLSVLNTNDVWASGQRGTVLRTVDGGRTWRVDTIAGAEGLDFRAIAATSNGVAHALATGPGDASRIYRTIDGSDWHLTYTSTRKEAFFDAIRFWDHSSFGIAISDPVDGRFLVLTTANGGESWHEEPPAGMPAALPGEGAFAASGSALFVHNAWDAWFVTGGAERARVFHSTDRGRTWTVSDLPLRAGVPSAGAFSIDFDPRNRLVGAVVGGDYQQPGLGGRNVAVTRDGGRTWVATDSARSPRGYRSAVSILPGSGGQRLVAVGLTGTDLSADGGRSWTPVDTVAYNSVATVNAGGGCVEGWAVGPKGRIARMRRCATGRDALPVRKDGR